MDKSIHVVFSFPSQKPSANKAAAPSTGFVMCQENASKSPLVFFFMHLFVSLTALLSSDGKYVLVWMETPSPPPPPPTHRELMRITVLTQQSGEWVRGLLITYQAA